MKHITAAVIMFQNRLSKKGKRSSIFPADVLDILCILTLNFDQKNCCLESKVK